MNRRQFLTGVSAAAVAVALPLGSSRLDLTDPNVRRQIIGRMRHVEPVVFGPDDYIVRADDLSSGIGKPFSVSFWLREQGNIESAFTWPPWRRDFVIDQYAIFNHPDPGVLSGNWIQLTERV